MSLPPYAQGSIPGGAARSPFRGGNFARWKHQAFPDAPYWWFRAFSSEVDTGSREENASKQKRRKKKKQKHTPPKKKKKKKKKKNRFFFFFFFFFIFLI